MSRSQRQDRSHFFTPIPSPRKAGQSSGSVSSLFLLAFLAGTWIVPLTASGCPYSVRDVGFVDLDSPPYRIYLFVRDDTPQKETFTAAFEEASAALFAESNVEAEIVNLDEQKSHPAVEHLRQWEVSTFPTALLISPRGQSIVLPISDETRPLKETLWATFQKVAMSPKREEIARNIVRAWCVIVLVQGNDSVENARGQKVITDAMGDFAGIMSRQGKTSEEQPHLIVVPGSSFGEEEILLWSLGLQDNSSGPRAAVLYARGRQIGPLLDGENLNRNLLLQVLTTIGMDCDCDADQRWLSGTAIPLGWGQKLRQEVVKYLGFDPDNPIVKDAVSRIWAGAAGASEAEDPFAYSEGEIANWDEVLSSSGMPGEEKAPGGSGSQPKRATPVRVEPKTASTLIGRVTTTTLIIIGVVAFFVVIGSAIIIRRARQKEAP